jgi:hypothetical protein
MWRMGCFLDEGDDLFSSSGKWFVYLTWEMGYSLVWEMGCLYDVGDGLFLQCGGWFISLTMEMACFLDDGKSFVSRSRNV